MKVSHDGITSQLRGLVVVVVHSSRAEHRFRIPVLYNEVVVVVAVFFFVYKEQKQNS